MIKSLGMKVRGEYWRSLLLAVLTAAGFFVGHFVALAPGDEAALGGLGR